jgi:hypothetical protein
LNIIGPAQLQVPLAKVKNKRFAPDGPNYKLLAFEGDAFSNPVAPVAKLASATKLLEFAQAGLPMLAIGNWSTAYAYGVSLVAFLSQG